MPTILPLTSRVVQLESGHPRECQWVTVAGKYNPINVGGKEGTYHSFASLGLPRHEE